MTYYQRNRERILAKRKSEYIHRPRSKRPSLTGERLKERKRSNQLAWSRKNRDKRREYYQRWKKNHPGSYRAHTARNDARKRSARSRVDADQLKQADRMVLSWRMDDFFICNYCGRMFPIEQLHVEHFIPIVRGGLHISSNLRKSCPYCNFKKGSKLLLGACWMFSNMPCSEVLEFT